MFGSTGSLNNLTMAQRRELFRDRPDGSSEESEAPSSAKTTGHKTLSGSGSSSDRTRNISPASPAHSSTGQLEGASLYIYRILFPEKDPLALYDSCMNLGLV